MCDEDSSLSSRVADSVGSDPALQGQCKDPPLRGGGGCGQEVENHTACSTHYTIYNIPVPVQSRIIQHVPFIIQYPVYSQYTLGPSTITHTAQKVTHTHSYVSCIYVLYSITLLFHYSDPS